MLDAEETTEGEREDLLTIKRLEMLKSLLQDPEVTETHVLC